MMENKFRLIHVAQILDPSGRHRYLMLRKTGDLHFTWFEESPDKQSDSPTEITGSTIEEALRLAHRKWKQDYIQSLICGFRYTLPERDEHGINALFHQMVSSYSSSNGIYYDDELGNNCFVQNASSQARALWQRLKAQQRL